MHHNANPERKDQAEATRLPYWVARLFIQSTGDSILARHECMSLQKNQTKEPLICHEPTSRPWEKVATDIFTLDDKNYLCTVTTTLGTLKWISYMAKQELSS